MCQTAISDVDDMDEISSTSHKKTGKLIEPRKIRKPLMEKKRRARINQSLDELKRIVVDAHKFAGQDLSRVNKLEKADILEMTVRYLKRKATPPADVYLAGYRQCIEQVQELLAEQWTDERRQLTGRRMVEHLESCVLRLHVPSPMPSKNRLSSTSSLSDESSTKGRNNCFLTSSSDDDSVEEEPLANGAPVFPSSSLLATNHNTKFQNTPPQSTWRPW